MNKNDVKTDANIRYDEQGRKLIQVAWEIGGPLVWVLADSDMDMW